jgi:hypothetical protein
MRNGNFSDFKSEKRGNDSKKMENNCNFVAMSSEIILF